MRGNSCNLNDRRSWQCFGWCRVQVEWSLWTLLLRTGRTGRIGRIEALLFTSQLFAPANWTLILRFHALSKSQPNSLSKSHLYLTTFKDLRPSHTSRYRFLINNTASPISEIYQLSTSTPLKEDHLHVQQKPFQPPAKRKYNLILEIFHSFSSIRYTDRHQTHPSRGTPYMPSLGHSMDMRHRNTFYRPFWLFDMMSKMGYLRVWESYKA